MSNAAALEIEEKRERLEHERFFELTPDLLAVLSPQGVLRRVNGAWERLLGWTPQELVGRRNDWMVDPEQRAQVNASREKMMSGAGLFKQEVRLRCKDGSYRTIRWSALAVPSEQGFYLLGRDVTDDRRQQRDLEAQLRQAQRLEAVGILAGGIAHDFNNLLSVILSYSTMLVADLHPDDRIREGLVQIQAAGQRAAALTRQLLAFSRRQIPQTAAETAIPPMRAAPQAIRKRLMLIDDQVVMLRLLAQALSRYELVQCTDPGEALERFRAGERFDAILCDVYMPGMNGPELQARLREIDQDQARRMLFLTGALLGADLREFLDFNPGRVLRKPVDLEVLRQAVADVLGKA